MADYRASIPGWLDAIHAEADKHDSAFAWPHDDICGVPIRHFTLMDFARLSQMGNAFCAEQFPSWEDFTVRPSVRLDAYNLLCYMHVKSSCNVWRNTWRRWRYSKIDDTDLYVEIARYFSDTYIDSLGAAEDKTRTPVNFWSSMVDYIDLLAKDYGWTADYMLNMPYRQLIQFVRKTVKRTNPKYPVSSVADRVIARHMMAEMEKSN